MSSAGVNLWALHLSSCLLVVLTLLSPCQVSVHGATLNAFGSGRHDGVERVKEVCPVLGQGVTSTQQGRTSSLVYFTDQEQGKVASNAAYTWSTDRQILEETAQTLERRGVTVAIINIDSCPQFAHRPDVAPGAIHVYQNRKYVFQGIHSSDALVSFVLKVNTPAVNSIDSKAHKKAFDKVEGPRLVGLLKRNSKEYKEFARAAGALHPYVSCHIVSDAMVLKEEEFPEPVGPLKHLKDKEPGTILYYEPYGENPTPLPGKRTAMEILKYFNEHQLSFLRRLYPYDIYATMHIYESSKRLVLAFLLPKTPEGLTLYKTLKRLASNESVGELKTHVLYVNMEDFPMNIGALERQFNVDLAKPVMGLVNITTGEARWFTKPDLHLLPKDDQMKEVVDWFARVARDNIRVDGKAPIETEKEEKEEKVVEPPKEDGDFQHIPADNGKESGGSLMKQDQDDKEEKDSTTPKEKEDDRDKSDPITEKAESMTDHDHLKVKRSTYMKKFDDGDKLFSQLFSFISKPIKAILGASSVSKKTIEPQPVEEDDKSGNVAVDPSVGEGQLPELKMSKTESHEQKKKVMKAQEKNMGAAAPKEDISNKDAKEKNDSLSGILTKPAESAALKNENKHDKKPKAKHDIKQEHFRPSGKLDTPYMRQFCARERDKIFKNIFRLLFSPIRWLFTPSEEVKAILEKEQTVVQAVHRLDSPYLRQFAATDKDKLITNSIRLLGKVITLPYTILFGSSSDKPVQTKPKEVRCDMFKGTEEDKILTNLLRFIFKPVSGIISTLRGKPSQKEVEPDHKGAFPAQPQDLETEVDQDELKESKVESEVKPAIKIQRKTDSVKKKPISGKKDQKEKVKQIKSSKKEKKKELNAPSNLMEAKEQQTKLKSDKKVKWKYGEESDTLFKSIYNAVKGLVTGQKKTPEERPKSLQAPVIPKEKPHVPDELTDREGDGEEKVKPIESTDEREGKAEKDNDKDDGIDKDKDDEDDDKDIDKDDLKDDYRDGRDDDKDDDGDDGDDDDEVKEEVSADKPSLKHGSKMDSEYLKKFKAEPEDKIFSNIFKSTIGQLVQGASATATGDGDAKSKSTEETKSDASHKHKSAKEKMKQGQKQRKLSAPVKIVKGTKQKVPVAKETKQKAPVAKETRPKVPVAKETKQKVPVAKETKQKVPVAKETKQKVPVAKETKQKVPVAKETKLKVRKYRKPVPVPDFKATADGHGQEGIHSKKVSSHMWGGKSEDKVLTSAFRFICGTLKNILTGNFKLHGGTKAKVEEIHDEDGDGLGDKADEVDTLGSMEQAEDSENKAETLNAIFREEAYGVKQNGEGHEAKEQEDSSDDFVEAVSDEESQEVDRSEQPDREGGQQALQEDGDENVDGLTQAEFLQDAFQDSDGGVIEEPEEKEENGVTGKDEGESDHEDDVAQDEEDDSITQSDFLTDVFTEEGEYHPEDENDDDHDHDHDEEQEDRGQTEDISQAEEDESIPQAEFLTGVSTEEVTKPEDKVVKAEEEEEEEDDDEEVDRVSQAEDDDSMPQSDFLTGVFSEEEYQPEDEVLGTDDQVEEDKQEDDVSQAEEDDSIAQSDFLTGVFSEEEYQPEDEIVEADDKKEDELVDDVAQAEEEDSIAQSDFLTGVFSEEVYQPEDEIVKADEEEDDEEVDGVSQAEDDDSIPQSDFLTGVFSEEEYQPEDEVLGTDDQVEEDEQEDDVSQAEEDDSMVQSDFLDGVFSEEEYQPEDEIVEADNQKGDEQEDDVAQAEEDDSIAQSDFLTGVFSEEEEEYKPEAEAQAARDQEEDEQVDDVDQAEVDDSITQSDFLNGVFSEEEYQPEDEIEKAEEEEEEDEQVDGLAQAEEDDSMPQSDFLTGVFSEEGYQPEDESVAADDHEGEDEHVGDVLQGEEDDSVTQSDFLDGVFSEEEDQPEDEVLTAEDQEEGNEEVGDEVTQEEDDDSIAQSDFLTGVFSEEEYQPEDEVVMADEQGDQDEQVGDVSQAEEDDSITQSDFLDGVFSEEEDQPEDEVVTADDQEEGNEGVGDEVTQEEDDDSIAQSDFLTGVFSEEDYQPENEVLEADDQDDEDEQEDVVTQEEDDDSIAQSDFLTGVFSDEEYRPEDENGEADEEEVKEKTDDVIDQEVEEDVAQEEDDDSMVQSDFLTGVFSEEDVEEEEGEEEEKQEQNEMDVDDENENDDQDDDKTLDSMTQEDFIDLAFTGNVDDNDVDDDDDDDQFKDADKPEYADDPEYLEKHVSYRPFSNDPRKQFQYTEVQDDDDKDTGSLFEHGEAYDRHRYSRQHL